MLVAMAPLHLKRIKMTEVMPEVDLAEGVAEFEKRQIAIEGADRFISSYLHYESFLDAAKWSGVNPSKRQEKAYYVYVLVNDQTDKVVYVGKGKGLRMFQHMREVKAGKISGLKKFKGLRRIIKAGQTVTPYILFKGMEEKLSYSVERMIIQGLLDKELLNDTAGFHNTNERDLEWCEVMLEKAPQLSGKEKQENPIQSAITAQITACISRSIEILMCEIKIAEDTGYIHNDYWNSDRFKAYKSYISKFPDRAPPPSIEMPLFS